MKTIDAPKGIVEIMIAPGCENELFAIIDDLSQSIPIIRMNNDQ